MQTKQMEAMVLNVDDDAAGRYATSRMLKLGGHAVVEASTGREAVRLARAERPDLIVLDVNLPDITGVEVVQQLKADPATAAIPVLHLSSTAVDAESVVRGLESGADAYLVEPVDEAVLLATVRALIRMGRAQREAAEARAEAEQRVREMEAIFEATSSPIIVYDGIGTPVRANAAATAAWGFDPVSMHRLEAAQRLALRDADSVAVPADRLPTTRALRGEVVHRERHLFTDASGREHVVLHSVSPLRDDGGVRGAVAVWHDVTEEDRAARVLAEAYQQLQQVNEEREAALEEIQAASEELEVANEELQVSQDQLQHEQARLRAVLDALPVTVASAEDPGCHVVRLNPAGTEFYGVEPGTNVSATPPTRETVPVRHFAEGRELWPRELPMQRAAAEGVELRDVEMRLLMPDGRQVTVLCNAVPIRDHDERITGAVATVTDITARKRMEEALREANERLEARVEERTAELAEANRALQQEVVERARAEAAVQAERQRFNDVLEMLPAYVILLDPDYHVPFANRFFRERFGDSLGQRCFEYLFGRSEPCENCETYRVMNSKGPHRWEWTGPDGRNYDIYDFPFTDVDGSPLIMEVGLDITERKRAEAELRDHQEHLEQLVQERTADLEHRNAQLAAEIAARTQAEEALERERGRMEVLAGTAAQLLAAPDPLATVNELCRRVMEFLDCQVFFNFLADERAGRLRLNASAGVPEETARALEWLDYGSAICGCVARDGCRIVAEHIPTRADSRTDLVRSFGVKAYACHPILSGETVLGTLSFGSKSHETFTDDELALMQAVTGQVAIAVVRKREEQAVRESEARYRQLFENMLDGYAYCQMLYAGEAPVDFTYLEVNRSFEKLTGLQDVVGKRVSEVIPGIQETNPEILEIYGRVARTGNPERFEAHLDALGLWLSISVYSPAPEYFVAVFDNITARKQAEEQRERLLVEVDRQRTWLDTVVENTEAHLVFLDRDFNFLHVNAAYARACRKAPEEFVGHNHFEFYPHEENEAIFRRVRDAGEPFSVREKPFEFPDMPERGVTYWDWTLMPIKGEAGAVEYLVFSLMEVTEQVRMRERLVEAERGRAEIAERMTAEINHRMKNNLMLLTSVMQMQLVSLPTRSAAADAIQDAMARIASLSVVHEHLYRGQSGKVELCDVLRRVGDVVGHALAAHRVAVTVTGEECYVSSKLGSTLAILANELITNAMKYGGASEDGRLQIAVSLTREDGQLRLRVWNSGDPIAATFDLARGSGMGLDLVQGVVTGQLGGSFTIRPDQGGTLAEMVFGEYVLESSQAKVEG